MTGCDKSQQPPEESEQHFPEQQGTILHDPLILAGLPVAASRVMRKELEKVSKPAEA